MNKCLKMLFSIILTITPIGAEGVYPMVTRSASHFISPIISRNTSMIKITHDYYVLKSEPKMSASAYDLSFVATMSSAKITVLVPPKPVTKAVSKPKPAYVQVGAIKSSDMSFYTGDSVTAWDHPYYHHYQKYCWKEATAAHKSLPLGSKARVFYNGKHVDVLITDRGPYVGGRDLDLSPYAMAQLAPDGLNWNQIVGWMNARGVLRASSGAKWCRLRKQ